ncbi:MAG: cytochrome c-type biosis protein CcmF [Solirubrobacteraceae bacterium]|nr:cytochrome c-type biosis protein CcmF [Solirubrobacteraceae bacterium]
MATFGRACLILGLAVALYGIAASIHGARSGRQDWVVSGRRAVYALAALTATAFAVLEIAFLRSDFSFEVVSTHSSTTTPFFYKVAAPWSSQEGSLLLWLLMLSIWSSMVLFLTRRRLREVAPYATAVLLAFAAFFGSLLVFLESPFQVLAIPPLEGSGLNPLLRHPSMMIHPPMLYSGYTLFAIPFAFAVGALITRRVDAEWIRSTRRFALAAWLFLGIGILLGARWSYNELGWGGYWAWDPVENASLMPWLTGTAFIHSIMIQERRGMLKIWNASLVLSTGVLAILGTFLVRSGILDSIHAFGASTLGIPFVSLIAVMVAGSIALVVSRRADLRSENRLDSLFSREAVFLGNNIVLVGLCAVIFFGTFFPLISEAITGDRAAVGPPWFNRYTVPLALMLVLLSGIGPLIAWRRASGAGARRNLLVPALAGLAVVVASLVLGAGSSPTTVAMFGFGAFVLGGITQEFVRGTRARRAMSDDGPARAVVTLVRRNRRRYGGYIVHAGMALLFIGIAGSSALQDTSDANLRPGQTMRVGGYDVKYVRPTSGIVTTADGRLEKVRFGSVLDVRRDGEHVATLRPSREFFPSTAIVAFGPVGRFFEGEATSEVGLKAGVLRDVWTAMTPDIDALKPIIDEGDKVYTRFADDPSVSASAKSEALAMILVGITERYRNDPPETTFRVIASPLVTWLWIGAIVIVAGALVALWPAGDPARRLVRAGYAAQVGRDLKVADDREPVQSAS